MRERNVLRVNATEERDGYRAAVAETLRIIQTDNEITLLEIAERVDVSLGTISNAANKKGDLSPTYLNRLGKVFGAHVLDPFARLCGARMVPLEADGAEDVLPVITMASHRIALARSPSSPGGTVETLKEQLDMLPDLRRLHRELGALICGIEKRKEAA